MTDREHIEIMSHIERLEQKVQKGGLLKQTLIEQNEGLKEQLATVTQLLLAQQGLCVPKPIEDSSLHQDQWLDNQDLSQLLHVSVRSLQRYRSDPARHDVIFSQNKPLCPQKVVPLSPIQANRTCVHSKI